MRVLRGVTDDAALAPLLIALQSTDMDSLALHATTAQQFESFT